MGAKTNLALVSGAQVMAVALLVVVAYTSTMGFLKQKKIDLYDLEQKPPSTEQTTKPKEINSNGGEPEQQQDGQRCWTDPGGGPPITADFRPC